MNYKYFPHTDTELKEMLEVCGKRSLDEHAGRTLPVSVHAVV